MPNVPAYGAFRIAILWFIGAAAADCQPWLFTGLSSSKVGLGKPNIRILS